MTARPTAHVLVPSAPEVTPSPPHPQPPRVRSLLSQHEYFAWRAYDNKVVYALDSLPNKKLRDALALEAKRGPAVAQAARDRARMDRERDRARREDDEAEKAPLSNDELRALVMPRKHAEVTGPPPLQGGPIRPTWPSPLASNPPVRLGHAQTPVLSNVAAGFLARVAPRPPHTPAPTAGVGGHARVEQGCCGLSRASCAEAKQREELLRRHHRQHQARIAALPPWQEAGDEGPCATIPCFNRPCFNRLRRHRCPGAKGHLAALRGFARLAGALGHAAVRELCVGLISGTAPTPAYSVSGHLSAAAHERAALTLRIPLFLLAGGHQPATAHERRDEAGRPGRAQQRAPH